MKHDVHLNFAIVGAMKSGTSTLHSLLASHHEVDLPAAKETNFFIEERNYHKGIEWYLSQFNDLTKKLGDASPNYSKAHIFPNVPERLYQHNPEIKILYIVRDPIERAVSHYKHLILRDEFNEDDFLPGRDGYSNLLNTSRYFFQIEKYRKHFSDDNIHILDFKDLSKNLISVKKELQLILGLVEEFPDYGTIHKNSSDVAARKSLMYIKLKRSNIYNQIRKNNIISGLYDSLPQFLQIQVRKVKFTDKPRQVPPLPERTLEDLKKDLRDDVTSFKDFAKKNFQHWDL